MALAALLDEIPPERFRYGHWAGQDWKGAADLSCGTTACALGWATTIPEFGLQLCRDGSAVFVTTKGYVPHETEDDFYLSLLAAETAFGLTHDEARYLFIPGDGYDVRPEGDASAKVVADHIREFVKSGLPKDFDQ